MRCSFRQVAAPWTKSRLSFVARYVLLLVQLLELFIFGYSQQNPFRIYTVRDGLISLQPQAIFQDADGFMWFGGLEGVSIYDGNHFTNFPAENKHHSTDYVFNFFQKNKDEVWALYSDGIEVFVKRKLMKTLAAGGINFVLRAKDQRVLAAGKGGIYEFIDDRPRIIFPSEKHFDRLFEIGNYFLGCEVPREKSILFDQSFHVVDSFSGHGTFLINRTNFWWFSEGTGKVSLLDTFSLKTKHVIRLIPAPSNISRIHDEGLSYPFRDSDGFVWLTSHRGVIRIDNDGNVRRFELSNGLGTNFATGYFEDCEGNIWLQTDGYIKFFNKGIDVFTETDGLWRSPVYSIAEDSTHNIWIAQGDGMVNMKGNVIHKFNYPHVVRTGESTPRMIIQGDSLWLAYFGLWLFKIHYGAKPRIDLKKKWLWWQRKRFVYANALGTYVDGTPLVNFNGGIYHITRKGQIERLATDKRYYTFLVSGNEFWTARFDHGVSRWKIIPSHDNLRLELVKHYDDIPGLRVLSISKDTCGNIWAGTLYKGVIELEKQKNDSFLVRNYGIQNGLQANVGYVFKDQSGKLYDYTTQGFYILHVDHDSVYGENLSRKYGFYGLLWSIAESKNGDLWLATQTGAVRIRKTLYQKSIPPPIYITGLLCNNTPDTSFVADGGVHSFSYRENNLSFEFTATTFKNEAEVLYSYQLQSDKHDSIWSQPTKIHQVSFASLSPGRYTLRVRALSLDDEWSKSPAEYSFIITAPYYETWWFRGLIIVLVIGIVSGLYRYRLSQVKKLLALRARISRDLHDEIGSALTSINILSKVSSTNLAKDSIKTFRLLEQITEQSQNIQQGMSDIVWAIRPDNDKLENMAIRMREYLGHVAEAKGLQVEFQIDDKALKESLGMQQRKDVFLIFKEAVNNAVKYSGGKKIVVFLGKDNHQIKLYVKDDGIGFNTTNVNSSSGLKNMRDRAKNLNGRLNIQSSEGGAGTTVEFIGPAT